MRILVFLLLLTGCSANSADYDASTSDPQTYQQPATDEADATDPAGVSDSQAVADPEDADPESVDPDDVEEPSFACTEDCSGHEAGFEWAKAHDITDEGDCGGDSESFTEGCEGFAQQRQEQAEEDAAENNQSGDVDDE